MLSINVLSFFCESEYRKKTFLPGFVSFILFKNFFRVFYARPFDEVVNVLKMIIKSLTIYSAFVRYILHRYFVKRLRAKQIFKRVRHRSFRDIAHNISYAV